MKPKRRVGGEHSVTRTAILDATQNLMVKAGYASVSTRSVAAEAGVKPALVQYYFPTMDDLFLALYRRAADQVAVRQAEALASDRPLQALWELNADDARAGLAVEFMALANHRKVIGAEMVKYVERARKEQAEAIARLLPESAEMTSPFPPAGIALLLAGAARALIMEGGLGIALGHFEARGIIERWVAAVHRGPVAPPPFADAAPNSASD